MALLAHRPICPFILQFAVCNLQLKGLESAVCSFATCNSQLHANLEAKNTRLIFPIERSGNSYVFKDALVVVVVFVAVVYCHLFAVVVVDDGQMWPSHVNMFTAIKVTIILLPLSSLFVCLQCLFANKHCFGH